MAADQQAEDSSNRVSVLVAVIRVYILDIRISNINNPLLAPASFPTDPQQNK